MKRVIRRVERRFWTIVLAYASIPVIIVLGHRVVMAVLPWLASLAAMVLAVWILRRFYRYFFRY
jgi:hypothetical protein